MSDSQKTENLSPLKKALIAIEESKSKLKALQKERREPIAIIGMSSRFPGAKNNKEFWDLLKNGVDAIREIPRDRFDIDDFYDSKPNNPGKIISRFGGYLDDIDHFDASFFGISRREAEKMDPQQRLVLEVAWEAMEDAALNPKEISKSKTSSFIGICSNDYTMVQKDNQGYDNIDAYYGSGNAASITANRLSYILDLQGPSMIIDTACSSSLVTVHMACQSLRNKESDMAFAGGVSVLLSPMSSISFSQANMLAPGGRCRTFDASAEGYVRGEGCGIIILKRFSDAQRDGDNILAVIKGSAVNQDGKTNGLTAPNSLAQQRVIADALKAANVKPEDIGYIEAHGTGTILGDPIEVQALGEIMKDRDLNDKCYLGSVKTNIGHLEGAAGIAGLIKTILILQNGEIPAHLNFKEINPHIPINELPFSISTESIKWPLNEKKKICGVSSFGFGGTNAHIIVQEAPQTDAEDITVEPPVHILNISARDKTALKEYTQKFSEFLESSHDLKPVNICYSVNTGRLDHPVRLSAINKDFDAIQKILADFAKDTSDESLYFSEKQVLKQKIAFMFTGQGAQYISMGRELYQSSAIFKECVDKCDSLLESAIGESIKEIIFSDKDDERIHQTQFTQPALFIIEYALACLWISWGIKPEFVIGHSIGEYVAAVIAEVFSLETGLRLVAERGRLMGSLPEGGSMAVIFADLEKVKEKIKTYQKSVSIAAKNTNENTVISGKKEDIDNICNVFESENIKTKKLIVSHAFHSPLMEPILDEFGKFAQSFEYQKPAITFVSNLTGQALKEAPDAIYWKNQIRQAVNFSDGIDALYDAGCTFFIETGPHPSLSGMTKTILAGKKNISITASLKRETNEWEFLLSNLAELYCSGLKIDWKEFYKPYNTKKVQLPTYPFQRERYWADPLPHTQTSVKQTHPLLGHAINSPLDDKQFENTFGNKDTLYQNITLYKSGIFPFSILLEEACAAKALTSPDKELYPIIFSDINNSRLLLAPDEKQFQKQFIVVNNKNSEIKFYTTGNVDFKEEAQWKNSLSLKFSDKKITLINFEEPENTQIVNLESLKEQLHQKGLFYKNIDQISQITKVKNAVIVTFNNKEITDKSFYLDTRAIDCIDAIINSIFNDRDIVLISSIDNLSLIKQDIVEQVIINSSANVFNVVAVNKQKEAVFQIHGLKLEKLPQDIFNQLKSKNESETSDSELKEDVSSMTPEEQKEIISRFLISDLARILKTSKEKISVSIPVTQLGLDSIMAIEIKNKVEEKFLCEIPISTLIQGPSIDELSEFIVSNLAKPSEKIEVEDKDPTILSHGQQAMYFQHKLAPDSVYNLLHAFRVKSSIDIDLIREALDFISSKHPVLRTNFKFENKKPVATIDENPKDFLHLIDAKDQTIDEIRQKINELVERPFNLEKDSLTRLYIFSRNAEDHVFLFVQHHIISDLWSMTVFMQEFTEYYSSKGKIKQTESRIDFSNFVARQNRLISGEKGKKHLNYWKNKLKGELPVLNLKTDFPRPAIQKYKGRTISIYLDKDKSDKLKTLSEKHNITLYTLLIAAYNILLHRYTGQDDLIIGTPASGRTRSEYSNILGYFVNPVAIRSILNGSQKFSDYIKTMKKEVTESLENQDYPFSYLVEQIHPDRDPSRTPVFQTMFVYQRAYMMHEAGMTDLAVEEEGGQLKLGDFVLESMSIENRVLPFDLTMMMAETAKGIGATLQYNISLFKEETASNLLGHFINLLNNIADTPEQKIKNIPIINDPQKHKLTNEWNQTAVDLQANNTLEMFFKTVQKSPNKTALCFNERTLTYRELDQKSDQIAYFLNDRGVKSEDIIAICAYRSIEFITSLFGVMKSGAAYLPVDPEYPQERIEYMLNDSNVKIAIASEKCQGLIKNDSIEIVNINQDFEKSPAGSSAVIEPENLAYVIYTSGSTGKPKGVLLQHKGLLNLTLAQIKAFRINQETNLLQFASFSFDAAISEIFTTLIAGGTLFLTEPDTLLNGTKLVQFINQKKITTSTLPPSVLRVLPASSLLSLKNVISAGEACTGEIAATWSVDRHFVNAYGPTETTVCATLQAFENFEGDLVTIGKPIDNVKVYILDKYMNPVPVGVPGELYISGLGLARGYLNKSGLTASSFIPNPFTSEEGSRMYRSGDLVRYVDDGQIEFLNRIDNQVKIRGFRIEIGEIESILKNNKVVKDAAVLTYGGTDKRLAAYVVSNTNGELNNEELKTNLRAHLPEYMIPTTFIKMDSFPLTTNGKIDFKALPKPEVKRAVFQKAETDTEIKLSKLWQEILQQENISVNDNFFELGGHSLNIIQMQERIKEIFEKEVDVVEMFRYPTIASFSKFLSGEKQVQRATKEDTEIRAAKQKQAADLQKQRMLNRRKR